MIFSNFVRMRLVLFLFAAFLHMQAITQSTAAGNWYGKAEAIARGTNNSYLTELILKQKGDELEGIFGYYYRNGYKSLFVRGTYNKKERTVSIKNIPVTYFKAADIDGVDCKMDLQATLLVSKAGSYLKGSLISQDNYRYTCPELTFYYKLDNSEEENIVVTRKLWQPQPQDVIVGTDTSLKGIAASKEPVFEKRKNILAQQLIVSSDSLRVSFYDNGEVDGDSISVFLNNAPVLVRQELTAEAINIYIKLDKSVAVNEITMYAENLGKYPPNTALMVVNDGEKRQEIYLSSSLKQNATVRIIRQ